jgi:hypothetical protein
MHIRTILEVLWLLTGVSWALRAGLRKNEPGFLLAVLFLAVGFFVFVQPI